jgi:FeS assembly protein SufD
MTMTLEKFIVPNKNEKWRFSGLKELDLAFYTRQRDGDIPDDHPALAKIPFGEFPVDPEKWPFNNLEDIPVGEGGASLAADDFLELLQEPFYDMGASALSELTRGASSVRSMKSLSRPGFASYFLRGERTIQRSREVFEVVEGGKATVVVSLQGAMGAKDNLMLLARRLVARRNATLDFVLINNLPLTAKNFNFVEVRAEEGAQVNVILLNLGSAYTRQEITAYMKGANANVQLRSLSLATAAQEIDQRTLQIHEAPSAKSDLLFKNVLADKGRTIFSGLIRVAEGAQKTDAYQKNRNLLLSAEAEANSLPGLEIEANDVRCTHGATNGKLSEEELFYLRARGVPYRDAQRLLVGGYCEEILAGLPEEAAAYVRQRLEERLG